MRTPSNPALWLAPLVSVCTSSWFVAGEPKGGLSLIGFVAGQVLSMVLSIRGVRTWRRENAAVHRRSLQLLPMATRWRLLLVVLSVALLWAAWVWVVRSSTWADLWWVAPGLVLWSLILALGLRLGPAFRRACESGEEIRST